MRDLVVSVPEAARLLRVSQWTIYRLLREGKLRSVVIGTRRLIPLDSLHTLLDAQGEAPDA